MKNKLLLIIFIGTMLLGSVLALDSLGTFKQGQTVRITQVCSDATYVTISSISYPNSVNATSPLNMTSGGGGEFYYKFNDTGLSGRYDVRGISDGCEKTFATYFEITPTGLLGTLGFYIILLILSLVIIIIGYGVEDEWVVILGGFGFILLGLFILLYGIVGIKDMVYSYSFGIITIMLGIYFAVRAALSKMNTGLDFFTE